MQDSRGSNNAALLALGGLAAAGAAGYWLWYLPNQRRQLIEAKMLADAAKAKAQGSPSWTDMLSSSACIAAAAYYSVPPSISGGLCRKYAPGLVKRGVTDAYNTTKGGIVGTVHGVESAGKSIGGAAYNVGKSVVAPFVSVGKSVGKVFSSIF